MSNFIFVILVTITIIFLFAAFILTRMFRNQQQHAKAIRQDFDYTANAIQEVGHDVQSIHGKLDQTLLPKIDKMYDQLLKPASKLNPTMVLESLHQIGITGARVITQDGNGIFGGIEDETGKKISILLNVDNENAIDMITFSVVVEKLQPEFLKRLLALNSTIRIGRFALRSIGGKNLITLDHSFYSSKGALDSEDLKSAIQMLLTTYKQFWQVLSETETASDQLLINEFVKLIGNNAP